MHLCIHLGKTMRLESPYDVWMRRLKLEAYPWLKSHSSSENMNRRRLLYLCRFPHHLCVTGLLLQKLALINHSKRSLGFASDYVCGMWKVCNMWESKGKTQEEDGVYGAGDWLLISRSASLRKKFRTWFQSDFSHNHTREIRVPVDL